MNKATYDSQAERPREQLEEMIRILGKDDQVRLMALVWIRQGRYRPSQWHKAIRDAGAAYAKGAMEELISFAPKG
jgi:hypothetical protein